MANTRTFVGGKITHNKLFALKQFMQRKGDTLSPDKLAKLKASIEYEEKLKLAESSKAAARQFQVDEVAGAANPECTKPEEKVESDKITDTDVDDVVGPAKPECTKPEEKIESDKIADTKVDDESDKVTDTEAECTDWIFTHPLPIAAKDAALVRESPQLCPHNT